MCFKIGLDCILIGTQENLLHWKDYCMFNMGERTGVVNICAFIFLYAIIFYEEIISVLLVLQCCIFHSLITESCHVSYNVIECSLLPWTRMGSVCISLPRKQILIIPFYFFLYFFFRTIVYCISIHPAPTPTITTTTKICSTICNATTCKWKGPNWDYMSSF